MSETELSVICKNCGSEVSPYVTECPYCGARLRKRAPKLERRGDALEPKPRRRSSRRLPKGMRLSRPAWAEAERPYATLTVIISSAVLILVQNATGDPLRTFGGLILPFQSDWWRVLTAPFAYADVGYLFVVALALAIFSVGVERRLGSAATALLLVACGSLGMLAASGIVNPESFQVIAGGNGMALGALAAWFTLRRAETQGAIDQEYDWIGVAVCAAVLLALPLFDSTANVYAGAVGGAVGGLAGLVAAALRHPS
jgi:membrane associated rhomboid family serine protease